jgi:1-acyl-sn-glycerol-3-phosphate acyltransferase
MSTLETLALPGFICPIRKVTYVVKESLMHGFFWGPIMRSRDPITVTRKDPRADLESVLEGGLERLKKGISVIIFPQGTRHDAFDRARFNSLGVKLAARAGVPVVPVALRTDWWGNGKILRGFGRVDRKIPIMFEFGEPIKVEGRGKVEHERVLDFIESRLRAWGAKVVDAPADGKPRD